MSADIRLERSVPRGAEAGCFITAGLILAVCGTAGVVWILFTKVDPMIMIGLVGIAGLAAIAGVTALLRGGYVAIASSRIPQPELRIDRSEMRPGDHVELHLSIPGPLDLEELFVTLRCDKSVLITVVEPVLDQGLEPNYGKKTVRTSEWQESVESIISLLREEHVRIPRGAKFERQLFVALPEDAQRTTDEKRLRFKWTFEIEARPAEWPAAIDEFPVKVV